MKHLTSLTFLTVLTTTEAFADAGHLAPVGHGHGHWLEYGVLMGIAVIVITPVVAHLACRKN